MSSGKRRKEYVLLESIRSGRPMSWRQRLELIVRLSVPSMLAQLSSIVMLYIDASMVGSLGAEASASIGLVSTTTWLFNGVCAAAATAFSVQAAHRIGADDMEGARTVLRQSFVAVPLFGLLLSGIGCSVSGSLPGWLGGNASIVPDAARYFLIYSLSLPFLQLNFLSGGMLRCSGNMRIPSMLSILMCVLDVVFNIAYLSVEGVASRRMDGFPARSGYGSGRSGDGDGAGRRRRVLPDDGLPLLALARARAPSPAG